MWHHGYTRLNSWHCIIFGIMQMPRVASFYHVYHGIILACEDHVCKCHNCLILPCLYDLCHNSLILSSVNCFFLSLWIKCMPRQVSFRIISCVPTILSLICWFQAVDDAMLRRFLRARSYNIDKSHKFLLQHLKWRREFVPNGSINPSDVQNEVKKEKLCIQGFDKAGRPIGVILANRHHAYNRDLEELKRMNWHTFRVSFTARKLYIHTHSCTLSILYLFVYWT